MLIDRYLHRSGKDPKSYPRQAALDSIKLIASHKSFDGKIREEDYVKTPAKPPRTQRNYQPKQKDISKIDPSFDVVGIEDPQR